MKKAIELIPGELQNVKLDDAVLARAVGMTEPTNRKVREAADRRMAFEDEPGAYLAFQSRNAGT
jgi:hypothetical protein